MEKKEQQQFINVIIEALGTTVISRRALKKALEAIINLLPIAVLRLIPRLLPYLPLAFEIAALLYKHREKIRDTIVPLTKQTSNAAKKGAAGIVEIVSHLPKKIGRKLSRWLAYLPVALEIAKAHYEKNSSKVQSLTAPLPSKLKKRIAKKVKKRIG